MTPAQIAKLERSRERNRKAAAKCRNHSLGKETSLRNVVQMEESEIDKRMAVNEDLRRQVDELQWWLTNHNCVKQ